MVWIRRVPFFMLRKLGLLLLLLLLLVLHEWLVLR